MFSTAITTTTGILLLLLLAGRTTHAALDFTLPTNVGSPPSSFDYNAWMAQDIYGKKHAFLAGNNAYYRGSGSWNEEGDETIGLTHPFFHDLRSRGTGIVEHETTGTGNDFWGWEFHKYVQIAFGTVIGGPHMNDTDDTLVIRNTLTLDDGNNNNTNTTTEVCLTFSELSNYGVDATLEPCTPRDTVRQQFTYNASSGLFRNAARGYCLFAGRQDLTNQKIQQWGCDETNPQMIWDYDATTGVIQARYGISQFGTTGKCISIAMSTSTSSDSDLNPIHAITDSCDTIGEKHTWELAPAELEIRHERPKPTKMIWRPDKLLLEYHINNVTITEEKFISEQDVVATRITSDTPLTIEFTGKTFAWDPSRTISKNATVEYIYDDGGNNNDNAVHVIEGGRVLAKVQETPEVIKEAKLMYTGMHTLLKSDKPLMDYRQTLLDVGEYSYTFRLEVNADDAMGTTLAWVMNDDFDTALAAINTLLSQPLVEQNAKTTSINHQLNYNIPYFRSSDASFDSVYYFLWSLQLLYYREVGKDQEVHRHTQTAVHNFLGMHNWDAIFQNHVGAYTSDLPNFAYGNILLWSELPDNATSSNGMIPDNMGRTWNSGLFGGLHHSYHACAAWQIYHHSGDLGFLQQAYDFFHRLFRNGGVYGENFDGSICLGNMAHELGRPSSELDHWAQHMVRYGGLDWYFAQRWDENRSCWGDCRATNTSRYDWTPFLAVAQQWFPSDKAAAMGREWLSSSQQQQQQQQPQGFFPSSEIPLAVLAQRDWDNVLCPGTLNTNSCGRGWLSNFWYTPDTNYFMLTSMWTHDVTDIALEATLGHFRKYHLQEEEEDGFLPCAPESRATDTSLRGDLYSNFNAGKILTVIEGIGGIEYSVVNRTLTHRGTLPLEWSEYEFRLPIRQEPTVTTVDWVLLREERYCSPSTDSTSTTDDDEFVQVFVKRITIASNPLEELHVRPWTEGATVLESDATSVLSNGSTVAVAAAAAASTSNRLGFTFRGDEAKGTITITLRLRQTDPSVNTTAIACTPLSPPPPPTPAPQQQPGANGDPLILGLQQQVFQFDGRDGAWYANLAIADKLQWNMQFRKFHHCPKDANMFLSGLSFRFGDDDTDDTNTPKILIATTREPISDCQENPDRICLGDGTLHFSWDGGSTFHSEPGDYHPFRDHGYRLVAHNTYGACSRKWHDYDVSTRSTTSPNHNHYSTKQSRLVRNGGRRASTTIVEKKPEQFLKDNKAQMIDPTHCQNWLQDRLSKHDLLEQRGHWSTIYIETPLVSFHIEYRQSHDWFHHPPLDAESSSSSCDFQSLDAWMTHVSAHLERSPARWGGILGETKYKVYDHVTGEEIRTDRYRLLAGTEDADYEVEGPFGTVFAAAAATAAAMA